MRISDWSSDVCSSDLQPRDAQFASLLGYPVDPALLDRRRAQPEIGHRFALAQLLGHVEHEVALAHGARDAQPLAAHPVEQLDRRSEEHTSELQSLMRTSYAVFCLTTHTIPPII